MDKKMNSYEGMFLVDVNTDFQAAGEPVRTILSRNEAEILSMKPWDERRLACEIRGRRRGQYILTYFKAPPERVADIEHDSQLDERILRMLILRRDNLTEDVIHAETPATAGARRAARRAEEHAGRGGPEAKAEEQEPQEAAAEAAEDAEDEVDGPAERPERTPRGRTPPDEAQSPEEGTD
jgi:small subunit ribosomal protein S6